MTIIQKPSKHFSPGRNGLRPEIIVVHIMDGTLVGTDAWFNNPRSFVSSHYGLGQNGEVHQYVQEQDTAWHAGMVSNPSFKLYKQGINPNLYSIGLEHEGHATTVWSQLMKQNSAELIRGISQRWGIPIDRDHIIGHYQIRSTKPNCPAVNKAIIDELIALAKGSPTLQTPSEVEEGLKLIEQGVEKIRKSYK